MHTYINITYIVTRRGTIDLIYEKNICIHADHLQHVFLPFY